MRNFNFSTYKQTLPQWYEVYLATHEHITYEEFFHKFCIDIKTGIFFKLEAASPGCTSSFKYYHEAASRSYMTSNEIDLSTTRYEQIRTSYPELFI